MGTWAETGTRVQALPFAHTGNRVKVDPKSRPSVGARVRVCNCSARWGARFRMGRALHLGRGAARGMVAPEELALP